ncbi:MAG: sulfurtransferase TusA family protein [Alphaproteobacteria bacterium]|nr:sulfurtransferase TusA family protein [Alphaproteobacteria bacterium]
MDEQRRPTPDQVLDATNLNCPLPILKTKRALGNVAIGGTLEVLATDPGSPDDFVAFAQSTGNTLIEQQLDDKGVFHFILRRDC